MGQIPWNKGKKLSKEHITKLSVARKGKAPWNKGINGPRPEKVTIRESVEYKDWRKSVFGRDNYTCQFCGQYGGILHADHIKPFAFYPELRLDLDNGRALCEACHKKTDTFGFKKCHAKMYTKQLLKELYK